MIYFRNGLQNDDGNCTYSVQWTIMNNFFAMYPDNQPDYRKLLHHITRTIEMFFSTGNVHS